MMNNVLKQQKESIGVLFIMFYWLSLQVTVISIISEKAGRTAKQMKR